MSKKKTHGVINNLFRWLFVLLCLAAIAHFSNQAFQTQDLRPEIRKHKTLVSEVRKLPEVRFTYSEKPTDNRSDPVDFIHFFIRKGAHVTVYGLLGISLAVALWGIGLHDKRRWLLAGVLLVAVASLDEWHQTLVGDRTGMAKDVLLDFCGFLIVAGFVWGVGKIGEFIARPKEAGNCCN